MASFYDGYNTIYTLREIETGAEISLYCNSYCDKKPVIKIGSVYGPTIGNITVEPENEKEWIAAFAARNHFVEEVNG